MSESATSATYTSSYTPSPSYTNTKSSSFSNKPSSYPSHCNNCGINGHTFSNCKFPITSVGLIAFRSNSRGDPPVSPPSNSACSRLGVAPQDPPSNSACSGATSIRLQAELPGGTPSRLQAELRGAPVLQYLLICRKDTIGFIEFMRGKYAINNRAYIQNLISDMTLLEKQRLLDNDFSTLWYNLWGDNVSNQFRSEEKNARDKFDALKEGITLNNSFGTNSFGSNSFANNSFGSNSFARDSSTFSLQSLITASETKWLEPEWGFPKGRHNNLEKDLNCGLREFEEETGYPSHCVKVVQNVMPYEEIFTGSNYKSYKHKYYLGQIDVLEKPKKRHQETEISKVEWCTYERALELIRPYNVEKLAVLEKVNKVLGRYTTHF